jgi:hypothetical protein
VVVPLSISPDGATLRISGTTANDQIVISQVGQNFTIANGSWQTSVSGNFTKLVVRGNGGNDSITLDASITEAADLYGAAGNDSLTGGSGNDRIFTGAGTNYVNGAAGNDTIVTIGSTADAVTGGAGTDSFWLDNNVNAETVTDLSAMENSANHLHRVGGFLNGVSTNLSGQNLADPKAISASATYQNFSTLPLFTDAGPAEDDIQQGAVGDCWFLSTISSVAKINSDVIRQRVVDLGDGTFAVQFNRAGQNVFVRVDADLPVSYGQAAYASTTNTKGESSLWVAIMEKALAEFRGSSTAPSYSSISGGWMTEAHDALGLSSTSLWSAASASDWAKQISDALIANKSVTYATNGNPSGALIGGHAYTVDHMGTDSLGNTTVTLRNPWGVDGAGSDGANDGYVTLTVQQAFANTIGCVFATV